MGLLGRARRRTHYLSPLMADLCIVAIVNPPVCAQIIREVNKVPIYGRLKFLSLLSLLQTFMMLLVDRHVLQYFRNIT